MTYDWLASRISMNAVIESLAPFGSAKAAVRFASGLEGMPSRPLASRMWDAMTGRSDWSSYDRAAQAGMIMGQLHVLGPVLVSVLVADASPISIPCACRRPCCSGRRLNNHWVSAIHRLAEEAIVALPERTRSTYVTRRALIVRTYGGGESLQKIADDAGVTEQTIVNQNRDIRAWLKGDRARRINGKDRPAIEGLEPQAWAGAEEILREHGIVG